MNSYYIKCPLFSQSHFSSILLLSLSLLCPSVSSLPTASVYRQVFRQIQYSGQRGPGPWQGKVGINQTKPTNQLSLFSSRLTFRNKINKLGLSCAKLRLKFAYPLRLTYYWKLYSRIPPNWRRRSSSIFQKFLFVFIFTSVTLQMLGSQFC